MFFTLCLITCSINSIFLFVMDSSKYRFAFTSGLSRSFSFTSTPLLLSLLSGSKVRASHSHTKVFTNVSFVTKWSCLFVFSLIFYCNIRFDITIFHFSFFFLVPLSGAIVLSTIYLLNSCIP